MVLQKSSSGGDINDNCVICSSLRSGDADTWNADRKQTRSDIKSALKPKKRHIKMRSPLGESDSFKSEKLKSHESRERERKKRLGSEAPPTLLK